MTTPLTLSAECRDDGTAVLTATGEIDLSNIDTFSEALAQAAGDGAVTVDLSGVDYLDSGAINALFSHIDRIRLVVNPVLMPVLTVSGLTEVVAVEQSPT
ncbi:MAG TPA: STAS domain-containing protein [Pseudonocardiaceae bacterium]|jgi:anti-anti-sigma factor|nr:STAS domain-containing protein [Pseudonocardiaceae bacterium]